ncbi:MAG: J domain-containing protein [Pseudomonadota bacterium]
MNDPYAILGVPRSADAQTIRKAYRKLAKELHPDARPDDAAAEERFKQVTAAFKLLSDPQARQRYDAGEIDASGQEKPSFHYRSRPGGASARGPAGRFEDLGDLFSDLFAGGAGPGPAGQRRAQRGPDMRARLAVSFEEAMRGAKRRVSLSAGRPLDISIPAGVEAGQVLRLRGQGAPGAAGGPPGDALVEVQIKPHGFFRREGDDIRIDLPISLKEAVYGARVRAPTVDGPVEVRVPAGATSGAVLRLRGKGAPKGSKERGDQLIRLLVDIPPGDPALESLLEAYSPPTGYDPRARMKE